MQNNASILLTFMWCSSVVVIFHLIKTYSIQNQILLQGCVLGIIGCIDEAAAAITCIMNDDLLLIAFVADVIDISIYKLKLPVN